MHGKHGEENAFMINVRLFGFSKTKENIKLKLIYNSESNKIFA